MPLAEFVPVAPAAGYSVVALGALIAFVVCWGLQNGWAHTFGAAFQWLGKKGIDISLRAAPDIHIHPFSFLLTIDRNIRQWLSEAMAASEHAMTAALHNALLIVYDLTYSTVLFAAKTYDAIHRLYHATAQAVPSTIYKTVVRPLDRATKATIATLKAREAALEHRVDRLAANVAHTTAVIPHEIATVPARVGYTSKQLRRLFRRVKALEHRTTGLAVAGVVAVALARLGLGWIRCKNVATAGKRICKMDASWLNALLGGFGLLYVSGGLVPLAKDAQNVVDDLASHVGTFLRANAIGPGYDRALGDFAPSKDA